jgi:hypothetical protein
MLLSKTVRRVVGALGVTAAAATMVAVTTTTASAAEGQWGVWSGSCGALEKVELGSDGHDRMAIDPISNPGGCLFGIWNNNTGGWAYGPTSSGAESPWLWDGPGMSLSSCVYGGSGWACGPAN